MADIDPAAVMAAHEGHHVVDGRCCSCNGHHAVYAGRCEPYRLAEALAAEQADHAEASREVHRLRPLLTAEQAKVARVRALAGRWSVSPGEVARWAAARVLDAALAGQLEQGSDRG